MYIRLELRFEFKVPVGLVGKYLGDTHSTNIQWNGGPLLWDVMGGVGSDALIVKPLVLSVIILFQYNSSQRSTFVESTALMDSMLPWRPIEFTLLTQHIYP